MVLDRLLRWLFWIAVMLLTLYAIVLYSSSRPAAPPPTPEEHRLFHYWWVDRGGGWVPDIAIYDRYGCYFFKDLRVNVAALPVLRTKGILPHTVPRGITDAGQDHATLFPGTRFAVEVRATTDTLVIIRPDLSMVSFDLQPDDVRDMLKRLHEAMETPSRPFSIVGELHRWASERGRTKLMELLDEYRDDREAEEFVPGPKQGASSCEASNG